MTDTIQKATCNRCGNVWWPRSPQRPVVCARCKSRSWDKPRIYALREDKRRAPGKWEPTPAPPSA